MVGQVKNIGIDTAESVQILLSVYDKNGNIIGTDNAYSNTFTLDPEQKSTFKFISSKDNFEGMKYYILSLQWSNSDGSLGYVENAQIYKDTLPKFLT